MAAQILIVTDDANLQALLRDSMTAAGYAALLATSGVDGLRRWKAEDPSLLVVDANLPGLDGIALTERIRSTELAGTRVGVIVLGGADPGVKLRALQAGADDHLVVPVH
jgi:DNA-binding response OmpR family regulator